MTDHTITQIIDRRLNSKKKNTVNRQRFIRRYKNQIKKSVADAVAHRSITEIDKGEVINIPAKDIAEPHFKHGQGGVREHVFPGNEEFTKGDHLKRHQSGSGNSSGKGNASNTGEGEDEFVFQLTREEFLELYFDDLALPDLVKKQLAKVTNYKYIRAGVTNSGSPSNINVVRSMRQATGRRIAFAAPYKKRLQDLYTTLAQLLANHAEDAPEVLALKEQISQQKRRLNTIPFIDTIDLRFNNRVKVAAPATQAVMFCIMDVSGSMDEAKKDIAKRFFILLYLFLTRTYNKIELVFIRHHTSAKEVSEEDFFYSRETGGTVVSSALELMRDIIASRYPHNAWNIYGAQASDGDNWNADSPYCQELLSNSIMPLVQYFSYIEIMPRHHQSLWEMYKKIQAAFDNFAMQNIDNIAEIYPVFRELFKRRLA